MVDFRYHIVSLIAVFMALAIGIVLGSGPLRDAFTGQMTSQYSQVQAERDQLREDLSTAQADEEKLTSYINTNRHSLSVGSLAGQNIALIISDEVDEEDVTQLTLSLTEAGVGIAAQIELTEKWDNPEERSFRQGIAGLLVEHMEPQPGADDPLEYRLPMALAQAVVQGGQGNTTMLQILQDSELIEPVAAYDELQGVLVLSADAPGDADAENPELRYQSLANLVSLSAEYTSGATLTLVTDGDSGFTDWLSGQTGVSHFAGPAEALTWTMSQVVLADSFAGNATGYSMYEQWSKFGPETDR